MLQEMLNKQKELNDRIIKTRNLPELTDLDYWLKQWFMAIITESAEMLEETNWKHWKNAKQIDVEALKKEAIDIQHFLFSVYLTLGMNAEEVYNIYMDKNKENHDRQDGKIQGRESYNVNMDELRSISVSALNNRGWEEL